MIGRYYPKRFISGYKEGGNNSVKASSGKLALCGLVQERHSSGCIFICSTLSYGLLEHPNLSNTIEKKILPNTNANA